MCTPDCSHDEPESVLSEWREPFPQPQTIPSGWNLSIMLPASAATSSGDDAVAAED